MSEVWASRSGSTRVFIFDREYDACLRIGEIITLEERTKSSVGEIWSRLLEARFMMTDLIEVTRLGLIGAGMDPEAVAKLIDAQCRSGYILKFAEIAAKIIGAAISGVEEDDPSEGEAPAPAVKKRKTKGSSGPGSSASPGPLDTPLNK